MLTEIYHKFPSEKIARRTLIAFKKRYRVALRGAVVIERKYPEVHAGFHVHAPLGGTGFSNAEMTSALREIEAALS
jgi:hypothetical protein